MYHNSARAPLSLRGVFLFLALMMGPYSAYLENRGDQMRKVQERMGEVRTILYATAVIG